MDGGKSGCGRGAWLQLFQGRGASFDTAPFCQEDDTLYEALNRLEGLKKKAESYRD